jgi:hypothetical protein
MKKLILLGLMACSFGLSAQSIKTPAPSPLQSIKQDFALSSIEVVYSRPSAKGRKIYGDLVPFGKVWRTGANQATQITFGEDVKVGNAPIKAGKYTLLSIPGKDSWEILFCKPDVAAGSYKPESEVARVSVKPSMLPFSIETFMIVFGEQTANSTKMSIMWDNVEVEFSISADIDSKIMTDIDKVMNNDNKPYFAAASYYFDSGKDLGKALEWVNKATDMNPKAYWMAHLKAKILAKQGNKAAAIETAKKSMELAKEGKNDDYVSLNEKLINSLK